MVSARTDGSSRPDSAYLGYESFSLEGTMRSFILFGSALSSIKLMSVGGLAAILYWEFSRITGGRRHRPAKSLAWLSASAPPAASWNSDREMWAVTLPDGSEMLSSSKDLIEAYLDHAENVRRVAGEWPAKATPSNRGGHCQVEPDADRDRATKGGDLSC
jgi:hypothetical protein